MTNNAFTCACCNYSTNQNSALCLINIFGRWRTIIVMENFSELIDQFRGYLVTGFVRGRDVFPILPTGFGTTLCFVCMPVAIYFRCVNCTRHPSKTKHQTIKVGLSLLIKVNWFIWQNVLISFNTSQSLKTAPIRKQQIQLTCYKYFSCQLRTHTVLVAITLILAMMYVIVRDFNCLGRLIAFQFHEWSLCKSPDPLLA